jgi:hypothetical protein
MSGLGWRKAREKNLKGGDQREKFFKFCPNIKGLPLIYKNDVPIL